MSADSELQNGQSPRWRYLVLAALIFVAAGAILAVLWQLPQVFPQLAGPAATSMGAGVTPATATLPPTLTPKPTPTPLAEPLIRRLGAAVDDEARTITFHLAAEVPPERSVKEVLLWYDTEAGHEPQRLDGPLYDSGSLSTSITLNYVLEAWTEGLTRTLTTTTELDYWWLVRDSAGDSARAGDSVILGPALQAMVVTPTPQPPPVDFTWSVSDTQHFQFYYMPGTAAERDRAQIGALAESSLDRIDTVLEMEFDGQMDIYFVPRIFWQGGAAYGDKVQLVSYLDRNYTGIETWSYFTHEGTHALAQDLLQPKENGGGPDGVLVEGLAVWASGGHYRVEPLDEWAAIVAASDGYLPLSELRAGSFYDFQHETSYLEGASFVKFLVERYGLDKLKELYGQATNDPEHDRVLVEFLYRRDYDELEADWLAYLSTLEPTPEQAEAWWLKVRSFDLMRRYETELDPDARVLPSTAPPEWMSDTLKIFLGRVNEPVNVVLETALIAAQERLYGSDPTGATALLDDVEAALDAGGELTRPSLQDRAAILDLLAAQDRAILRADADAYRATLTPGYAHVLGSAVEEALQPPFVSYWQEVVRLDIADDGLRAEGTVLLHAQLADSDLADDGQLFAVAFVKTTDGWLLSRRTRRETALSLPPPLGD